MSSKAMAAAEARAAWQRSANRCFVQEDAKRAPKLASSLSKQRRTPNGAEDFAPPTPNSMYSNLSPDSRWWLQLQPNYMVYQKGATNEQGNSHQFVDITDSESSVKGYNAAGEESYELVEMKEVEEFSLESEFPHWMESSPTQEELPWWHKDDLASFVAQRSHDFMENCDLPQPQNRNRNFNLFGVAEAQKHQCPNMSADSGPVRESITGDEEARSKRRLLEALCHSQTRAREAEKAAKQAYEEKEHVVKLIFKQASQLFAYKQWVYLLQLENLYNQIQIKAAAASPPPPPPPRTPAARRREHDNCGVAFAVGLGLVGAGLLLGWTLGWMLI